MEKFWFILIIILSGCLFSCIEDNKQLKDIDKYIESNPEKALVELEKINTTKISSQDYSYYCLLYTQAQIKNGIVVSSDSLIRNARDAFSNSDHRDLKRRAFFYNAKVLYNQRNLMGSMKDAIAAYDISKEENDSYWIAKTAELLGDIFHASYNYSQSERYTIEAVEYYKKSGHELNHRYALCDFAAIYINENRGAEAKNILDSLRNIVVKEEPLDSALYDYLNMVSYSILDKNDKHSEIKMLNHPLTGDEEIDFALIKSDMLKNAGDAASSLNLLLDATHHVADDKQRIQVMYAIYQHSLMIEDYKKASLMADSLLLIQSNIVRDMLRDSVTGVQSDYYSLKSKNQEKKSRQLYIILITAIVGLIICFLLIVIYRLKLKAKKAELELNIALLHSSKEQMENVKDEKKRLSEELSNNKNALDELHKQLDEKLQKDTENKNALELLFKEKWETLNMLCNEYFIIDDTRASKAYILNRIEKEIKNLSSRKNLNEIESAVNRYMDNIMKLLREECSFKEDDYQFLTLIYAGLSVRAICLFTGIKFKYFYLKKSRLSNRIIESDAPHKELFLSKLE